MSATSLFGYCSRTMLGAPGGALGGGVAAVAADAIGMPGATWAKAPITGSTKRKAREKTLSTSFFTRSEYHRQHGSPTRIARRSPSPWDGAVIGGMLKQRADPRLPCPTARRCSGAKHIPRLPCGLVDP